MHDNFFLTFIRRRTDGILEKLWLLNLNGVLTNFRQIPHCFFNCLYRFPVIASVSTAKHLVSGYSVCTCSFRFRFGVHFESVKSIVSIKLTCLISFRSLKTIIMLLDSITGHLRIVKNYHRAFNLQNIDLS